MNYKLFLILLMFTGAALAETVNKVSVDFSVDQAQAIISALNQVIIERAPRIDAPTADSPSYPVVSGDAADLALIRSALCALRLRLDVTLGSVKDPGSCFPAIATNADIDAATLTIIGWLKTLMRELRGTCP